MVTALTISEDLEEYSNICGWESLVWMGGRKLKARLI